MRREKFWLSQSSALRAAPPAAKTPGIREAPRRHRRYARPAAPPHFQRPSPPSSLLTAGSVKLKMVPPPGFGRGVIEPPCDSTMVREIDRPTPMPWLLVVMNG